MKNKNKIKLGKITTEDYIKACKVVARETDFDFHVGWAQTHKVHKSKKMYNRKSQSWKKDWDFSFYPTTNLCPLSNLTF
jgi:hypothetical protein